jgi:hypothetical protein
VGTSRKRKFRITSNKKPGPLGGPGVKVGKHA